MSSFMDRSDKLVCQLDVLALELPKVVSNGRAAEEDEQAGGFGPGVRGKGQRRIRAPKKEQEICF